MAGMDADHAAIDVVSRCREGGFRKIPVRAEQKAEQDAANDQEISDEGHLASPPASAPDPLPGASINGKKRQSFQTDKMRE